MYSLSGFRYAQPRLRTQAAMRLNPGSRFAKRKRRSLTRSLVERQVHDTRQLPAQIGPKTVDLSGSEFGLGVPAFGSEPVDGKLRPYYSLEITLAF